MGNVQIREPPRRRNTPIFQTHTRTNSKSPLRTLLSQDSPQHRHLSPIRYRAGQPAIQSGRTAQRRLNKQGSEAQRSMVRVRQSEQVEADNKQKCQDIIRRVRNFNDFLVELKKKLAFNCAITENVPQVQTKREFSMSVRLQNQKLQLEKYKKLVERELSKTHSIENIAIEEAKGGQKILTIKYEGNNQGVKTQTFKHVDPSSQTIRKNHTFSTQNAQTNVKPSVVFRQQMQKQPSPKIKIQIQPAVSSEAEERERQAKRLLGYLQWKRDELGTQMSLESTYREQASGPVDYIQSKQRLTRIRQLHSTLAEANRRGIDIQNRTTQLLNQ